MLGKWQGITCQPINGVCIQVADFPPSPFCYPLALNTLKENHTILITFPQLGAKFKFKGLNFGLDGPCGAGHMIILVFVSLRMYIELYAVVAYYFGQHPDGARILEIK